MSVSAFVRNIKRSYLKRFYGPGFSAKFFLCPPDTYTSLKNPTSKTTLNMFEEFNKE